MFPLGFAGLAFGLFLIDCAIKKRPVWASLKAIITDPKGFSDDNAKLDNSTFQEPSPIVEAQTGSDAGIDAGLGLGGTGNVTGKAGPVVAYALAQVGKPYVWAAAGPNAFDCSGLAMMAYRQVGINLPHGSTLQAGMGTAITPNDQSKWLPGDLLFPHPGHVEIYVGDGAEVEAMNPSMGIRNNPAAQSYWRVRRYL